MFCISNYQYKIFQTIILKENQTMTLSTSRIAEKSIVNIPIIDRTNQYQKQKSIPEKDNTKYIQKIG